LIGAQQRAMSRDHTVGPGAIYHPSPHVVWTGVKTFLTVLIVILMAGTLGVLFAGLVGLARGSPDPHRSNRLMRWRVILQGTAILLLLILMSLMHS
jgi:NADH:ubiquinone oxidoreductase subunit 6 (subunit J)